MLLLRKESATSIDVEVAPGAVVTVRPASALDVERASAEVALVVAALAGGVDAAETLAAWLGDDFSGGDFEDRAWRAAVIGHATLVKLAVKCCLSWSGIALAETGEAAELTEENVALLLREHSTARKISTAIETRVHLESAEKNGSAASPIGAAAADEPTAQNAGAQPSLAPSDSPERAETSARKL